MSEPLIEKREEVKTLLRRLFRSENADLDFGIYRIMNFKREEIEKFIEHDLIEAAETEFKEYSKVGAADLESELERLRTEVNRDFGSGTIDSEGRVTRNHDAPKINDYLLVQAEYKRASLTQEQVNDVFNHVYEFFSRYYEDGDFFPKPKYGGREKYIIPYNGEEVVLHWANRDQYYVKTGEYFKKYSFKTGRFRVNFVLLEAKVETNNVKGAKKFFVLADKDPVRLDETAGEVEIKFNYRGLIDGEKERLGTRNIQAALVTETLERINSLLESSSISAILQGRSDEKSLMERHLNAYVDRNTKDFFIHKDLKGFFEREFDFYLKNEVWNLDELGSFSEGGARLMAAKVKAIRGISQKIIEFLFQIEDFQKRLFDKKKFVLRSDYCITLDLVPEEFYEEIGKNTDQVSEWKRILKLDETTRNTLYDIEGKGVLDVSFLKLHKNLVLDTAFFVQEFKDRLIGAFENLEDKTLGLIIKSENYQALRLILDKYRGKVKCTYIDPPYNTGNDDGFPYKDNYQHSTWLTMMENRVTVARDLMSEEGLIFQSIDDLELENSRELLNRCLGRENFVEQIIWKNKFGAGAKTKGFIGLHEYVLCYCASQDKFKDIEIPYSEKSQNMFNQKDEKFRTRGPFGTQALETTSMAERRNLRFPIIYHGKEIWPKKQWLWSKERVEQALKNNELVITESEEKYGVRFKQYLYDENGKMRRGKPLSILDGPYTQEGSGEIEDLFGYNIYPFPKPSRLVKNLLNIFINGNPTDKDLFLDFFAGSGTTAQAVLELNEENAGSRKYVLIEMGDCFDTVIKPRIQKIMYSKEWKDGKPISNQGISHMFKYVKLEQYEDTLNNIVFMASDGTTQEILDAFRDYFLRYMLDYDTRGSPTRLSVAQFKTPFNYKIKTLSSGKEKEELVDLLETFNYLLGLHVNKIRAYRNGDRVYRVVFGGHDLEQVIVVWRDTPGLDLERDKKFIEETILAGSSPDTIYVNGDSYVKNARSIEPEFGRLMCA